MLRPVEGAGREYEYRRLSVLGALAGGRLQAVCVPAEALLQYTVPREEFLQNTLTLKPGETGTLTAAVTPENTSDKPVVWASSDETVATVEHRPLDRCRAAVFG